jgi:glycosyltransferase involved in cell wall biosynthesis
MTSEAHAHPLVTVVLPVRNEADRIVACLESLLRQDYPHDRMEVLVLDGMSTDRTPEIVRAFAQQHPFIRLVENPRKIQVAALNEGIRIARGHYVLRMDGHAEYADDYVSTCVYYLEKTRAENVGGPAVTCPGRDTLMARTIAAVTQNKFAVGGSAFRTSHRPQYCDTAIFGAWRRDLFEKVGLFNDVLARGEDNEFNSRIASVGGKIFMSPRIRIRYFNQATLRGLLRQAYGNGVWHVLTIVANPRSFKIRYFAPFGFVMWWIAFGVLAALHSAFVWPLVAAAALYAVLLAVVAVQVGRDAGWAEGLFSPIVVLPYHVAYGLGTLAGLFKFGVFGRDYRQRARRGSQFPDPDHPPRLGTEALPESEIADLD